MPINDKTPKTGKAVLIKKSTVKKIEDAPQKIEATVIDPLSESKPQSIIAKKDPVVVNNKVLPITTSQSTSQSTSESKPKSIVSKKDPVVANNKVLPIAPSQPITANAANVIGKMSIVVKMSEMPKQYKKLENGIHEFIIDMQAMELVIRTPFQMFIKFFRAKKEALQWIAAIEGKVSQLTDTQIIVDDAKIFVVNKELKPNDVVVADNIANRLRERGYSATIIIKRIIEKLGIETTNILVQQAKEIFFGEGLWLEYEQRKRTLGGVFLFLAKQQLSKEDWLSMSKPKVNKPTDALQEENITPSS